MKKKISSMGIVGVIHPPPREAEFLVLEIEGEWVFPKGHVHAGEDFVDAAIREVEEESGVHLTRGEHLGQVDTFSFCFEGEQAIKVIEAQLFGIRERQPISYNRPEGFSDGRWLPASEALKRLSHEDARNALGKSVEALRASQYEKTRLA